MTVKKVKEIVAIRVSFEDYQQPDFVFPSRYCIRDGRGDMVFYKSNNRQLVQDQVDREYGVNMYTVRMV